MDNILFGIEPGEDDIEYWIEIVYHDGYREITCPKCGNVKVVEPDAVYRYTCTCTRMIQVPEPVIG